MATINSIQDILDSQEDLRAFQALSETEQTEVLETLNPLFKTGSQEDRQELMQFIGQQPTTLPLRDVPALAIQNFPKSIVNIGSDIAQAIGSPVETFKAIRDVAVGGVQQLIPGEQPQEESFNQMVEFFKERFGGVENLKRTIAEDPAGFLTDISSVATGAGGVLPLIKTGGRIGQIARTGETIAKGAALADPITAIGKGVSLLAAEGIPRTSTSLVKSAIKPSAALSPKLTAGQQLARSDLLANEFINRGLKFNRKSIETLETGIKEVQGEISQITARETLKGQTIRTADVINSLDEITENLDQLGFVTPDISKSKRVIEKFKAETLAESPEFLTPNQAQEFKKFLNRKFVPNAKEGASAIRAAATDKLRSTTRQMLIDRFPQLEALNFNQGVMLELQDAITKRIKSLEEQAPVGATGLLAGAGGATTGGIVAGQAGETITQTVGQAAGFGVGAIIVEKTLRSPKVQIALAKALNRANSVLAQTGKIGLITQPSFQAGRLAGELEEEQR